MSRPLRSMDRRRPKHSRPHEASSRVDRATSSIEPRPDSERRWVPGLLLACVVAGVALVVHARVFWYPFIQDDWWYLYRVWTVDTLRLLHEEVLPTRTSTGPMWPLYRPIWPIYFLIVSKAFALNAIWAHVTALTLHVASSLLVVLILTRITRDALIGWLSGVLYAGASLVHMDPLIWAAGIYESGSMFLSLVSIWCFLAGHTWRAAAAFAAALLFKESAAFLPVLFAAVALLDNVPGPWAAMTWRWSLRRFIPIGLVVALYLGLKLTGPSPLALPSNHPYALRLTGPHLLRNISTYCRWAVGAVFPSHLLMEECAAAVLAVAFVILVVAYLLRGRRERSCPCHSGAITLVVWLLGAMSIYLFMPNHVFRYYLTPALPALLGLMLLSLRSGLGLLRVPQRVAAAIMILLVSVSVTSSFVFF